MKCPSSEAYASDGTVRVVRFYIGDEPNASDSSSEPCNVVRTVIEQVLEECDMHSLLLDSGADASIFPASISLLGVPSSVSPSCLRDSHPCSIPLHGMRHVEVHLMDMHGHSVVLKETVALNDRNSQPVLCFRFFLKVVGRSKVLSKRWHTDPVLPFQLKCRTVPWPYVVGCAW